VRYLWILSVDGVPRMSLTTRKPAMAGELPRPPVPAGVFRFALDALPDGVLLVDADRQVVYANKAFMEQWRFPEEAWEGWSESRMLAHASAQLVDPDRFLEHVEVLHLTDEAYRDELHLKDGRVFARRSVPFAADGSFRARIWIFTDITEARFSLLDPLSGVHNRRAYKQEFPAFVEAPDDGLLKCVAILDVDHFKAYNDHYGHAAGDRVLKRVGDLLRGMLGRSDDRVFRIGGEEFLLACRLREDAEGACFCDEIRVAIAGMAIAHRGNPPHGVVTASMGFGIFRGERRTAEIFDEVDAALYQAKAEGRNTLRRAVL